MLPFTQRRHFWRFVFAGMLFVLSIFVSKFFDQSASITIEANVISAHGQANQSEILRAVAEKNILFLRGALGAFAERDAMIATLENCGVVQDVEMNARELSFWCTSKNGDVLHPYLWQL